MQLDDRRVGLEHLAGQPREAEGAERLLDHLELGHGADAAPALRRIGDVVGPGRAAIGGVDVVEVGEADALAIGFDDPVAPGRIDHGGGEPAGVLVRRDDVVGVHEGPHVGRVAPGQQARAVVGDDRAQGDRHQSLRSPP